MNAPNPVQPGSSISHWDPITSPSQLMEPNANDDLTHSVQAPQDLTLALMRDIGWTAAAVSGAGSFAPSALAFGNRLMGYGNHPHNITFTNSGQGALTISGVNLSGSATFSQTHNCPGSLAAAASCMITVVFAPNSQVAQNTTLSVTSDAPTSPHTMSISGTGVLNLSFSLARPQRTARSGVPSSAANTFELTITPPAGFTGEAELSCAGDAGISCAVRPGRVTIAGAPVSATVTVKVAGRSLRLRRSAAAVTETRFIRLTAVVDGVAQVVEFPVQVTH
ncbi:MAG: choice-of-anchor D domain-containing protein, partial [Terriglobales bacterium]